MCVHIYVVARHQVSSCIVLQYAFEKVAQWTKSLPFSWMS